MHDTRTLASAPHQAARPGMPVEPAHASPRHFSLASLQNMIATWRWRRHYRWELEERARSNPHLIEDIGLTTREVEAEIAKRFWQR